MGEKKNIIFIAAACFVLIIAGVVAYMFLFSSGARINKLLKTATQYLSEENYEEAVTCYEKALIIKADNEKAREGIINTYSTWADSLVSKGNITGAIRLLENAVENNKYAKNNQILTAKLNELQDALAASKPKVEVVEEEPEEPEEPEETYDFDISINESDFDFTVFGKNVTEWDLASIREFVENDESLHLDGEDYKEKRYMNEENTLEVVVAKDGTCVIVMDKDNYLMISNVDYEGFAYKTEWMLLHYPDEYPKLGNVLPTQPLIGETIKDYLDGYSPELNDYILDKSIKYHLDTELENAVLGTSEWVRDDTSAEIRGLRIDFGTWMVDLHHSTHVAIDYIRYYY